MIQGARQWTSTAAFALLLLRVLPTHADEKKFAASHAVNPQIAQGQALFERNCVTCHGIGGTGGRGPNLARLRLSRAPDETALRALIVSGIPPEMPEGAFFTEEDVGVLAAYVRSLGKIAARDSPGDAVRGAEIFVRSGCPACHIVSGKGSGFGPELTTESDRRSAAYVRDAILQPSVALPADFLMVRAIAMTGETVQGIRVNEDTYTIQIKDSAGRFFSFRKADLKHLEKLKGQTPMPAFEGALTSIELQDLVAYLESPQREP